MAGKNEVTIRVTGDISDVDGKLNKVGDDLDKLGNKTEQTGKKGGGLKDAFKGIDMTAVQMAAGSIADLGNKTIEFGKKAIDAAGSAQAMNAQFDQVFGDMAGSATKNLDQIASETNILPNRLKPTFTMMAAFAKTTGMDTAGALDLTTRATRAAADSAAFYDKSIGEVSESLQSYLKGNYENDAALGISSTETTRNAAANKLYGKSFKDLSESQKQLTLLQMVEDGNKLSGALGQAAREGDGLENVTGNMDQAMQDFYATIGQEIFPTFIKIMTEGVKVIQGMAEWFGNLPKPVKQLVVVIGALLAAFAALLPIITAVATLFTSGLIAAIAPFLPIIAAVVAAVVAAIMIFLNWGDIVEWLQGVWKAFSSWIVDLWNGIVDAASDIFSSMGQWFSDLWNDIVDSAQSIWQGLTTWFSDLWQGIVDGAVSIWNGFTSTLSGIWQGIVDVASNIWNGLVDVVKFVWELIKSIINSALTFIGSIIQAGMNIVVGIMQGVWNIIGDKVIEVWTTITDFLSSVWQGIVDVATTVWDSLVSVISYVWQRISDTATQVWDIISAFLSQIWNGIVTNFTTIWNAIVNVATTVWNAISNATQSVWNAILGFLVPIWNKLKDTVTSVWNAIKNFIVNTWNGVKDTSTKVWNGIVQFLTNLWNGIKNTVTNVFNAMKNVITNVWNTIKSTASNIWNGIKDTISNMVNGAKDKAVSGFNSMKSTVTSTWDNIKSTASRVWNGIKDAIMTPIDAATSFVGRQVDKIVGFFSNMRIKFPHIPLPHFSIQGSFSLKPPRVPTLGVDWYAKGGVFNQASVIGVGEAGSEAVLPLKENVLSKIGAMIAKTMPTGAGGYDREIAGTGQVINHVQVTVEGNIDSDQRVTQLANKVVDVITDQQNAKRSAWE